MFRPFSSDRSRDVAMATNFRGKIGRIGLLIPSFVALAFRNGLEYCNGDGHVNSGDDPSIAYKFGELRSSNYGVL